MKPLVSVLVPAYNHEKYVGAAIESVLAQTYENIELLISDDCSTDGTRDVISGYSDERVKPFFLEKNGGTVNALNTLLRAAEGEYIAVLGSDDIWLPDKLEKQLAVMEEKPEIAACFTACEIIDENSETVKDSSVFSSKVMSFENCSRQEMLCRLFFTGNHFCHSSVLIRTSVHREIGEYRLQYRQLHDLDLWVRLLLNYPVYIIGKKLVKYRVALSQENVSKNAPANNTRMFREASYIFPEMFNKISDSDFIAGFGEKFIKSGAVLHEQLMCEKFFLLWNSSLWEYDCRLPAVDYLMANIDDAAFYKCLSEEYGFTLSDIYNATGSRLYDSPQEVFADDGTLQSENSVLKQELTNIHNSRMWKYFCLLKKIKAFFGRKL